jgi:hypothetical protein
MPGVREKGTVLHPFEVLSPEHLEVARARQKHVPDSGGL